MVQTARINHRLLSDNEIMLIQTSFSKVLPITDTVAELFYGKLFELEPTLRSLFKSDIGLQKKKLMQTLKSIVFSLRQIDIVIPALQELGRRHAHYNIKDKHYEVVGAALLWTLEQGLGAEFTPPVKNAWISAYTLIASTMKEGMYKNAIQVN